MAGPHSTDVAENAGYCACCRSQTLFREHDPWLRDFYLCAKCGSIPRQRHVQTVLDEVVPGWDALEIHESSPSNSLIERWCSRYSSSQYLPHVPFGDTAEGVRSENIEALTFADASLDIFVTQDVLEHVFDPERAIQEIHRVLRPGGVHVFTTPKHRTIGPSVRRAALTASGSIEHLLPEQYHGNPVGDNKALVTWDFGDDFDDLLSRWSGTSVHAIHRRDRTRGLDGEFLEVWVIRKPTEAPASAEPPSRLALGISRARSEAGRVYRGLRRRAASRLHRGD